MDDCLTFPKTVDEFMEKYKIVDTEQVYTNGAQLVPIFRMRQWFEHTDYVSVVRCRECVHRDPENHKCDSGEMERAGCVFPVDDDYFCKCGKRREDGAI